MNVALSVAAITLVVVATASIGFYGLRVSRTTSDFFVASRTVRPFWNASALGGEYVSAATFLGLTGLVLLEGARGFVYPIGFAAGYLLVLVFIAAPLRRSGAYTIPDFLHARTQSRAVRRVTSLAVLLIGWLYIVPQLQGAGIALALVAGVPPWAGAVLVALLVVGAVAGGGMRAVTYVQAFHFWAKFVALVVPLVVLAIALRAQIGGGADAGALAAAFPPAAGPGALPVYETVSLTFALLFGAMGLPHLLVRFYTSPTGVQARTTTAIVIVLISGFYTASSGLALIARVVAPDLAEPGVADAALFLLPSRVVPGPVGDVLTALLSAGALAAFLAISTGLVVSLAGTVSRDVFRGSVRSFRLSAVLCTVIPLVAALLLAPRGLSASVGVVFVLGACTLSPVLLLAVWWRRLSARGALAGMLTGGVACGAAFVVSGALGETADASMLGALFAQPAAWAIPLATLTAIVVSLTDPRGAPANTVRMLTRLHTPQLG